MMMVYQGVLLLLLWIAIHVGVVLLPRTPHAIRMVFALIVPILWIQAFHTLCLRASGWRVVSTVGAIMFSLLTLSLLAGGSMLLRGHWRTSAFLVALVEPSIVMLILVGLDRYSPKTPRTRA